MMRTDSGSDGRIHRAANPISVPKVAESPTRRTASLLCSDNRLIRLRKWAPRSAPMNECNSSITTNKSDANTELKRWGWFTNSDSIDSGVIRSTPEGCSSRRRFGDDDTSLESAIVGELVRRELTIGTAESCTGGAIADALVSVAGVSQTFRGSIVAYANDVKTALLGVPPATLAAEGAVSEATALAMARGARERLGVDIAISTTGVAGPDGGTPEKPVGLVWFGYAGPDGDAQAVKINFPGTRADIRTRAATAALNLIWRRLESTSPAVGVVR